MIFELRLYSVAPGRMNALHARFERLPKLFDKHGVRCVGQWTALSGPRLPGFVYLMAYADLAEREARWAPFYTDPEWLSLRAETNGDVEIVERYDLMFLKPNAAWQPEAPVPGQAGGGLHELLMHEAALGQGALTNAFLRDVQLPLLREHGARTLMVADMASGPRMPQVVAMLAWPDLATRDAAWHAVTSNEAWLAALAQQRATVGWPVLGRTDTYLLEPAARCDFGLATLAGENTR
ncbi:MAG: hypothetical protein JWQ73_3454 [Variovorax sp.]|nr:hypothetical protein [Variovorax sp.]